MSLDIQQYIASGIIESYVLGLSSEQETKDVEENAMQHQEVSHAIENYRNSLEKYASLQAVSPPQELKAKIWRAIQTEPTAPLEVRGESDAVAPLISPEKNRFQQTGQSLIRYFAAAATVLLLVSATLNVIYLAKYRRVRNSYDQLIVSRNDLITQNQVYQTRISQVESEAAIIHEPGIKPIVMEGVKEHPGMRATVYWNAQSKNVYLAVNRLPLPPAYMQYQLWAIVDGKPVSEGVFDLDQADHALQKMASVSNAQAFAITLEKRGGTVAPTMSNMYVMGKS
jgi:anti-sigma-K factor RskA